MKLSLKLLQIADHLTDNALGFKLYFSDLSLDNYVVRDDLKVTIADAENILIVDEQQFPESVDPVRGSGKPKTLCSECALSACVSLVVAQCYQLASKAQQQNLHMKSVL